MYLDVLGQIQLLLVGPLLWFADRPVNAATVPRSGSAVYTIWDRAGTFVYVGMSGRTLTATGKGPFGRLNDHTNGRRSGDQFNVYVSDRFVLPRVHNRISEIAAGTPSLDKLTRDYIRAELGLRVVAVPSPAEAFPLERRLQWGSGRQGRRCSTHLRALHKLTRNALAAALRRAAQLAACREASPQNNLRSAMRHVPRG